MKTHDITVGLNYQSNTPQGYGNDVGHPHFVLPFMAAILCHMTSKRLVQIKDDGYKILSTMLRRYCTLEYFQPNNYKPTFKIMSLCNCTERARYPSFRRLVLNVRMAFCGNFFTGQFRQSFPCFMKYIFVCTHFLYPCSHNDIRNCPD